jgi:hypothetical protein
MRSYQLTRRTRARPRRQYGGKFKLGQWLKKAGTWIKDKGIPFLKKHSLVSRGLNALSKVPRLAAYSGQISKASDISKQAGYGRRRITKTRTMTRGGALRVSGGRRCR